MKLLGSTLVFLILLFIHLVSDDGATWAASVAHSSCLTGSRIPDCSKEFNRIPLKGIYKNIG